MNKAGGIIAMVAGVFSVIAAFVTLTVGGLGSAFKADNADTVVALGWGGVIFSFLVIVLGAVAFFKPRGAGFGLIVCSIAGAILGGTIVAVFMVLSLVGGVLCMVGSRRKAGVTVNVQSSSREGNGIYSELEKLAGLRDQGVLTEAEFQAQKMKVLTGSPQPMHSPSVVEGTLPQPTDASSLPGQQSRSRTKQWVVAGAAMLFAIAIGVAFVSSTKSQASGKSPAETNDPLVTVANAQPANIAPDGEIATMFTLGSNYTELQRENKLNELKDQIVAWSLPVYEVKRDGDGYKVQTSNHRVVGTFVYLTARNDEERRFIEQLKTGDTIPVKGRIVGSSLRNLVIKTAILNNGLYPASQTSHGTNETTPASLGTALDVQVYIAPDAESVVKGAGLTEVTIKDAVRQGLAKRKINSIPDNAVIEGLEDWVSVRFSTAVSSILPTTPLSVELSVRNGASANNQLVRWQGTSAVAETATPDAILQAVDSLLTDLAGDFNSPAYKTGRANEVSQ